MQDTDGVEHQDNVDSRSLGGQSTSHFDEGKSNGSDKMDQVLVIVTELKGDVTELKGDVTELKGDVTKLKDDVSELKRDFIGLDNKVDALSAKFDGFDYKLEGQNSKIDAQNKLIEAQDAKTAGKIATFKYWIIAGAVAVGGQITGFWQKLAEVWNTLGN